MSFKKDLEENIKILAEMHNERKDRWILRFVPQPYRLNNHLLFSCVYRKPRKISKGTNWLIYRNCGQILWCQNKYKFEGVENYGLGEKELHEIAHFLHAIREVTMDKNE